MNKPLSERIRQALSGELLMEITEIRRHLHRNPELSFEEHQTSAYIRALLDQWGISYDYPFVNTGILARIEGENPGKCLALRADMDALPIQEKSGLDFSSGNPGVMHACGHDVHMSALLGSLRILNAMRDEIRGSILFIFQPGEEKLPGGARLMLKEGVFSKYRPDMILAQHVLPEMPAGRVGFRGGMYMASSDEIYLRVKGKGGHGALRHLLKDPILMASRILLDLQESVNAAAPPEIPTVLSFGKVLADGATNVVPDSVYLEGTFRTMNEDWRSEAHRLIHERTGKICTEMGGSFDLEIRKGYPVLHNHEEMTLKASRMAREFLGEKRVEELDRRMTAEDFAWFTQEIPGLMYRLGIRNPEEEQVYPLHTAGFRADESALKTGISLMAYLSIELLKTSQS